MISFTTTSENYLEMNRRQGGRTGFVPKPEVEKNTLVRIIKEIQPDIIGVAEMGPPERPKRALCLPGLREAASNRLLFHILADTHHAETLTLRPFRF
jgi:hypothetical protein